MISDRSPLTITETDVVVVGAGAAGVGAGVALLHAGIERFLILDRHGVGASFDRWPQEMRFITPSFATNSVGMLDINSVAIGTSPAFSLQVEHPSGREYAAFLRGMVEHFELPVRSGTDVAAINVLKDGFLLDTSQGQVRTWVVVWAAGEFQYPQAASFLGAELCRHSATVDSWKSVAGKEVVVIGGYESGIDAAIHLARLGKRVTVLDRSDPPPWPSKASDPSVALSAYTIGRLHDPQVTQQLPLVGGAAVADVSRNRGAFQVRCVNGAQYRTSVPPILATGFRGSVSLIAGLFQSREDGYSLLSAHDESTITPGLFLCGPMVRHEDLIFCFIYKCRQRHALCCVALACSTAIDVGVGCICRGIVFPPRLAPSDDLPHPAWRSDDLPRLKHPAVKDRARCHTLLPWNARERTVVAAEQMAVAWRLLGIAIARDVEKFLPASHHRNNRRG